MCLLLFKSRNSVFSCDSAKDWRKQASEKAESKCPKHENVQPDNAARLPKEKGLQKCSVRRYDFSRWFREQPATLHLKRYMYIY